MKLNKGDTVRFKYEIHKSWNSVQRSCNFNRWRRYLYFNEHRKIYCKERRNLRRRGIMGILLFSIGMPLIIMIVIVSFKLGYNYHRDVKCTKDDEVKE